MIQIPEDGWGADTPDLSGNLLAGTVLTEASFTVPEWSGSEPADPASGADSARERAASVFRRQRSVSAFNRELDTLSASIAEAPDWSDGLERFDHQIEELRQRHAGNLSDAEDREAFTRHAGEFAAMQRIGLKRALVERQASDALTQLDDQLTYYAGKSAGADHDTFRQIAVDSGLRAIGELQQVGYLTPEETEARRRAFLAQAEGQNEKTKASRPVQPDSLDGTGVGDGEIAELKPVKELSDEEIERFEKMLDALLLATSIAPPGRYAKAARDTFNAIRAFIQRHRTSNTPADKAETPAERQISLPAGGIREVKASDNLANGRYAADQVLTRKADVENAMYRPDVGTITFRYGTPGTPSKRYTDGNGLSHIVARRNLEGTDGEAFVRETLPDVLTHGRLMRLYGPPNARRADIEFKQNRVVLSQFRLGKRETWVLTGFEKVN